MFTCAAADGNRVLPPQEQRLHLSAKAWSARSPPVPLKHPSESRNLAPSQSTENNRKTPSLAPFPENLVLLLRRASRYPRPPKEVSSTRRKVFCWQTCWLFDNLNRKRTFN
jgi:hypothetical protein